MTTSTITVREIHCPRCEDTIRTVLSGLDGVMIVRPNRHTNQVRISYDDARISEQDLRTGLTELGYEPVE